MKTLVLVLGLIVPILGLADSYSASDAQGNNIVLTDIPCADVGWIKLLTARFRYKGKDLKACWMASGDSVILFDETVDTFTVPKSVFKKDTTV